MLKSLRILLLIAICALLLTVSLARPVTAAQTTAQGIGATPTAVMPGLITPTHTPFPPEYLHNSDQAVGITLGALAVVIIIIVGALVFMPKHKKP